MSDFNILIGVDMANAESDIKKSIERIGETYKLKLDMMIMNEDKVIKGVKHIESMFKALANLDVDFGLAKDSKQAEEIKTTLKEIMKTDLSSVGDELQASMKKAEKEIDDVRKAYEKLMKVTDRELPDGSKVQSKKEGSKYKNKTQTTIKNEDGSRIEKAPTFTRDFNALNTYVEKAQSKLSSMAKVTSQFNGEVEDLAGRLSKLASKLASGDEIDDEIKSINGLIEHYDKLERELVEAGKTREAQTKEAIKWANKLAEVERKGMANPASQKKMGRLVGELDSSEFKNLEKLSKKLLEISNQYAKIQGQEKDTAFRRSVVDEGKKAQEKVKNAKLNPSLTTDEDHKKLNDAVDGVKNAKNALQLDNALKKLNKTYDEVMNKQKQHVEGSKAESEALNKKLSVAKKEADEQNRMMNARADAVQKNLDDEKKYREQHDEAKANEAKKAAEREWKDMQDNLNKSQKARDEKYAEQDKQIMQQYKDEEDMYAKLEENKRKKLDEETKEANRLHELKAQQVQNSLDEQAKYEKAHETAKAKEAADRAKKESDELEKLNQTRVKKMQEREEAERKLENQMADGRERAEAARRERDRADQEKQQKAAGDESQRVGQNKANLKDSKKGMNTELDRIGKDHKGLVDADELEKARKAMNDLDAASENFDKELKDVEKTIREMGSKYDNLHDKQRKINVSTHDWNKEIDQIRAGGFVNDNEFDKIRQSMRSLSADSSTYEQDLKRIDAQIKRMNTLSTKRAERSETRDIAKGRNDQKIESMRGVVPDNILNEVKGLNNMLDFSSSKKDVALIEDEMKRISELNRDIIAAGRDEEKIRKAIADSQESAVRSADKYDDIVKDVVKNAQRQAESHNRLARIQNDIKANQQEIDALVQKGASRTEAENRALENKRNTIQRLEQEQRQALQSQQDMSQKAAALQTRINELKARGTQLSYEEQRAIQEQIQELKRLARAQADSDGNGNSRDKQEQSLRDRFNSTSYRATRGFGENSKEARELRKIIQGIEQQINGLSGRVGSEFDEATRQIERDMNRLNDASRRMRDEDQRRRGSTSGQLVNALRKVPIWAAAMGLVYGTMEQIRQGFQSIMDVDAAMINLAKVSEASKQQLNDFKTTASEMGRELGVAAKDVINATTAFQRLGYTLEQSTGLGKNSILYANVGDMSVEDASDNLTSTIKGFGVEVDDAGTNVRRVVDMFNEVSNNFAISASGIGEALKRSSSVMNEAGNSMEQAVALAASANAVIQDPDKVGNGLKTIAMRLRGVKEEGAAIDELAPQLQTTFDRINKEFGLMGEDALQVMEKDGQTFKSTYDIFSEVVGIWDKLSDMEQANLVETMGGKHQGVIVSAIIQNWKDAESAADTASNSAGSAAREFSAYMDGFQYKIGQLKNALEHFWATVIDDDTVKSLIDALTSIIDMMTKVVDTVGAAPLLAVITGLFAAFASKDLMNAITATTNLGGAFKGLGGWILNAVKLIPRFLPYIGILLAIGEAANLVYKAFTADSRQRKERLTQLDSEISKLQEFKDNYEGAFGDKAGFSIEDMEKLQSKGVNRTTEEEQKYLETINLIKDSMPELISYYNEKGEAVLKTAGEVRALVAAQDELLVQGREEQLNLNVEEADFGDIEKKLERFEQARDQLTAGDGVEQMQSVAKQYLENEVKEINGSNYEEVLTEYKDRIMKVYESMTPDQQNLASMQYQAISNVIPRVENKDQALMAIQGLVNDNKAMRKLWEDDVAKTTQSLKVGSEEVNKYIDEAFSIFVTKRGIKTSSNTFLFIEDLRQNMIDNLAEFGPDIEKTISSIPDYIDKTISSVESKGIKLDDLIKPSQENYPEIKRQIEDIRNELAKADPNNPLIKMYDLLILKHTQAYNAIKNAPLKPFEFTADVMNPVQSLIGELSDLDSAYRQVSEGTQLSIATTMDLVTKHPELIKSMKMENGMLTLTGKSIKDLAKIREEAFKADIRQKRQQREEARATAEVAIKAAEAEVKALKAKLTALNIANKAAAKSANGPTESNNGPWKEGYGPNGKKTSSPFGVEIPFVDDSFDRMINKVTENTVNKTKEAEDAVKTAQKNAVDIQNEIDAMDKLLNQDWSANLGNIGNIAKPDKPKKEKEPKEKQIQDGYYVVDKYAKAMEVLNRSIERQQKLQGESATWSATYKKSIKDEISLTNQKKKAVDNEIASLKKQIAAKKIQKYGLITIDSGEDNRTARLKAAEIQQEIDQAQSRLLDLAGESDSATTRVQELAMMGVQAELDTYANQRDSLSDDVAYQDHMISLYATSTESYRKHVNEKLKLMQKQQKFNEQELAYLEKEKKANKSLTAAQKDELDSLIRSKREEIYNMKGAINSLNMDKVNSKSDQFDKQKDSLSDDIAYQEYAMGLYDQTTQAYRDHANEKLKLLKEEQKINKEKLAWLEKEKATNKELTQAEIDEMNTRIRAGREEVYQTAEAIQDAGNLIANSGLEKFLWAMNDETEKYAESISSIQDKMKYELEDDKDYGKRIDYMKQIIELRKGERADALKNIKYLEGQLVLYSDNQEMVDKITTELKKWKGTLKDAENGIKDINLEMKTVYEEIGDKYVELYKEQLQKMQEADANYYKDKIEQEEKSHEKKMKQIEDELDALQKAHDQKMKQIEREEAARDFTKDSSKLQKEADELKKQIDLLSMDDSYESKSKKAELVKQLSDKELELSELNHDREVDLRKENLEDDLESEKDKLDARKDRYEEDNKNLKESLEKEAEEKQKHWEAELENEKRFAELRKEVLDGNFEKMFETINTWKENVSDKMSELGKEVTENFTYKIKEAIKSMEDLNKMEIGSLKESTNKNGTKNLDADPKPIATTPKEHELTDADIIAEMKRNSARWKTATTDEEKAKLQADNQALGKSIGAIYDAKKGQWYKSDGKTKLFGFDTGGYTGDWSGDEGRLAVLHKKEVVLNDRQTAHILDAARIMDKVKTIIPTANLMNGVSKQQVEQAAPSMSETNEYNIEVNINGNADKKVADTVADQIINRLKRTKGGRM